MANRQDRNGHTNEWGLSEAEIAVIEQLCLGKTNKGIADTLLLAANTVRNHLTSIYKKMGPYPPGYGRRILVIHKWLRFKWFGDNNDQEM